MKPSYTMFLLHAPTLDPNARKFRFFKSLLAVQRGAGVEYGCILGTAVQLISEQNIKNISNEVEGYNVLLEKDNDTSKINFKEKPFFLKEISLKEKVALQLCSAEILTAMKYFNTHGLPNKIVSLSGNKENVIVSYLLSKFFDIPLVYLEHRTYFQRNLFKLRSSSVILYLISKFFNFISYKKILTVSSMDWELQKYLIHNADIYTSVSQNLYLNLLKCYQSYEGEKLNRIIYITPNPLPKSFIQQNEKFRDYLVEFKKEFVLFSAWQAWERKHKRGDLLIKAFASALLEEPTCRLVIGGTGTDQMKQLASELLVEDKVMFLGSLDQSQVYSVAGVSDFIVIASDAETYSLPVIEAMSLGTPVLATRCGGPEMLIERAELGELVDTGNVESLANAMVKMSRHVESYSSMLITDHYKKNYSTDALSLKWNTIYKQYNLLD